MNQMDQPDSPLVPGLKATTRVVAERIAQLEADVVLHHRERAHLAALHAAYTAMYLRQFLAEFVGPTWHVWAQTDER